MLWKSDGSFTYLEIVQETNQKQSHARTLSGTMSNASIEIGCHIVFHFL